MSDHLNDVSLLGIVAGASSEDEIRSAEVHLAECQLCRESLEAVKALDANLRSLAPGELERDLAEAGLPSADPFCERPTPISGLAAGGGEDAILASEAGLALSVGLLADVCDTSRVPAVPQDLRADRPNERFGLLYALQSAGLRIAEGPVRIRAFASSVLDLESISVSRGTSSRVEQMLPWAVVQAQAHLLAALASLWLKEFAAARSHLLIAYAEFARRGDETSVALVELAEAQRRFFVGEFPATLTLGHRARLTFEARALDDMAARAAVAEGLALVALGRVEDGISAYRSALPVFERFEVWSNYVGCVNSLATALYKDGRLDEARREFARALRRFSREQHPSWLGYLQHGLGDILLTSGKYRDAAAAFSHAAAHFEECGLRASALTSGLAEAQSWQEAGDSERAKARIDAVARLASEDQSLDQSVTRSIAAAVSHSRLNAKELADLRVRVQALVVKSPA